MAGTENIREKVYISKDEEWKSRRNVLRRYFPLVYFSKICPTPIIMGNISILFNLHSRLRCTLEVAKMG